MRARVAALAFLFGGSTHVSAQNKELDEMLAGVLIRNGLLCSQVVDKRPAILSNKIEVTCIQYRGGRMRVRYVFDT